jgi:hypothetical protein
MKALPPGLFEDFMRWLEEVGHKNFPESFHPNFEELFTDIGILYFTLPEEHQPDFEVKIFMMMPESILIDFGSTLARKLPGGR